VRAGRGGRRCGGRRGRPAGDSRIGVWIDRSGHLIQELRPDGRYSETHGSRRDAYTGCYWLDGDRVDYLDDLGFYAFGDFVDGELLHAEFRPAAARRRARRAEPASPGRVTGQLGSRVTEVTEQ